MPWFWCTADRRARAASSCIAACRRATAASAPRPTSSSRSRRNRAFSRTAVMPQRRRGSQDFSYDAVFGEGTGDTKNLAVGSHWKSQMVIGSDDLTAITPGSLDSCQMGVGKSPNGHRTAVRRLSDNCPKVTGWSLEPARPSDSVLQANIMGSLEQLMHYVDPVTACKKHAQNHS